MAKKEEKLRMEGTITKSLPGTQFLVELEMDTRYWPISQEKCANIISVFCLETALPWSYLPTISPGAGLFIDTKKGRLLPHHFHQLRQQKRRKKKANKLNVS